MNVLCFIRDPRTGRILFGRRSDPDAWVGKWNGIAGSMGRGESAEEAASRKVLEETGLVIPYTDWRIVVYAGKDLVVLRCEADLSKAKGLVETLIQYPWNSNWNREPVLDNLKWLIPLAFRTDGDAIHAEDPVS